MEYIEINGRPVNSWCDNVDTKTLEQIGNLCQLPFLYHHLAVMPDAHAGMGMPIGGVLATVDAVVPNAVGVDIGCGMCAMKSDIRCESLSRKDLMALVNDIKRRIPTGYDWHDEAQDECHMPQGFDISSLHVIRGQYPSACRQVGTLGGGNHFIELQCDDEGFLWVMIHTGSRNLGKQVGEYYNKIAQRLNAAYHSVVSDELDLAFLPLRTHEFKAYWDEMTYCIAFARCNRQLIISRIRECISNRYPRTHFAATIDIAHNYAAWERHYGNSVIVHRKGAVRAMQGEIGIIPGSQGTCSYITEGLGNPRSFTSSSHGAGRIMSRNRAKHTLDLDAEIARMNAQGIIHDMHSIHDLDEAAGAYKDIDQVMASQTDLVKIKTRLRPIAVIKGSNEHKK